MTNAVKLLLEQNFYMFSRRCIAHVLNIVVGKAHEIFEEHIQSARNFCVLLHTSSLFKQTYVEFCESNGIATPKTIPLDVKTRWNSTLMILESYVEQAFSIEQFLSQENGYSYLCIDSSSLSTIRNLIQLLKPFKDTTKDLSASKTATASHVLFCLDDLHKLIVQASTDPEFPFVINEAAEKMCQVFREKYSDLIYDFYAATASILDPRLKTNMLPISDLEVKNNIKGIRSLLPRSQKIVNRTMYQLRTMPNLLLEQKLLRRLHTLRNYTIEKKLQ
ncbi:hypothetical protein GEMRC1_006439 [Eukaryota sp. GEM-RC1]